MNVKRDPDAILAAWMDEGPTRLPDQTRRAIVVALPTTSQRRHALSAPWRYPNMSTPIRLFIGAAAVIAVVLGGAFVFRPGAPASGVGGGPVVTPSPTPAASPTASLTPIDTSSWLPFSSARYGYSMKIPPGWITTPSTRAWDLTTDRTNEMTRGAGADGFNAADQSIYFSVFAAPMPAGMSSDEWLAAYHGQDGKASPNPCEMPLDVGITSVGGHAATFTTEPDTAVCGGSHAYVQIGDKMYVFSVWLSGQEALFKAFVSTVTFQPATASPSAS